MRKISLLIIFLSLHVLVFAQDPSDSLSLEAIMNQKIDEQDQIQVVDKFKANTGSKSEETVGESPAVITVLRQLDIQSFGANTLVDVLNRVTAMYITGSYLYRQNNAVIRGDLQTHFNTHVLFLIDGRPIRESLFAGMDMAILNAYPLDAIERIEIARGPGSVLFGTGAYTGIIHIITKKKTTKNQIGITGGSFDTFGASLSSTQEVSKDLSITSHLQYYNQNGWDFTARDERDTLRTVKYGQENVGLNVALDYKKLSIKSYYGSSKMAIMGSSPVWSSTLAFNNDVMDTRRYFIDVGYDFDIKKDVWRSTINATYNGLRIDRFLLGDRPTDGRSNDFLLEMTNYFKFGKKVNVIFGALATSVNGQIKGNVAALGNRNQYWVKPYDDIRWGTYIQFEYKIFPFMKLIGGAQANKIPNIDLDIVPRVGGIFNFLNETLGAKILWGQAFRNPGQLELNSDIPGLVVGNTNLNAEKVSTFDAQLFYQFTNYYFSASYFNTRQNELIARITTGVPSPTYSNVGELTSEGGEFEFKAFTNNQRFNFTGSYSYQQNENERGIKDVSFISNHMIKAGIAYNSPKGLSIGVFSSHFSKPNNMDDFYRTDTNPNPIVIRNEVPTSFNLLSVNIDLKLNKLFNLGEKSPDLVFNIYGTNLLDKEVYDPQFMPRPRQINSLPAMPGRAIYSSLKLRF
jgi:outer membrane cobalamin receptor